MINSHISKWEIEAAKHLEASLNAAYNNQNTRVKLWADAFSTNENPNKRTQVFLGHQRTERQKLAVTDRGSVYLKKFFVEFRVEIFTLKNHQNALDLIEFILDEVMIDFRPFLEFSPFIIGESGGVNRNEDNQSWIYQGSGYCEITSDIGQLTPIISDNPEYRFIRIGLFNQDAIADNQRIGQFRKEEST